MPYGVKRGIWRKLGPENRLTAQKEYVKQQTEVAKAEAEKLKAEQEAKAIKSKARQIRRENSANPVTRAIEKAKAKHKAKMAEIQAQGKNATLDSVAKQKKIETDAEVAKITAKGKADAFKYSAIAAGMTELGRGLSDENNQDVKARYDADQKKIDTIFGNTQNANSGPNQNTIDGKTEDGNSYGLSDGTY